MNILYNYVELCLNFTTDNYSNVMWFIFCRGNKWKTVVKEGTSSLDSPVKCATGLEGRMTRLGLLVGESLWCGWCNCWDIPALDAEVPCNGNENGLPPVVCVYLCFKCAHANRWWCKKTMISLNLAILYKNLHIIWVVFFCCCFYDVIFLQNKVRQVCLAKYRSQSCCRKETTSFSPPSLFCTCSCLSKGVKPKSHVPPSSYPNPWLLPSHRSVRRAQETDSQ